MGGGRPLGPRQPGHEQWCVKKRDLKMLRRMVRGEIDAGRILPTEGDRFDPQDNVFGPSVYTVTEQLIKPVTAEAGARSWALMRHPEGLTCDIFITHSWSEGAFEFIEKVLASWPIRKRAAWCCILANPQALDIGGLLQDPRTSPFAIALRASRYVMVVPTVRASVYSRIWCIYEAHLAVECNSVVFTAASPLRVEGRKYVAVAILFAGLGSIAGVLLPRDAYLYDEISMWTVLLVVVSQLCTRCAPVSCLINALALAGFVAQWVWMFRHTRVTEHVQFQTAVRMSPEGYLVSSVALCTYFIASEIDRLRLAQSRWEARKLKLGYSGVTDAAASVQADKDRIMEDIGDNVAAVDASINVLIASGMSTSCLRANAALGIDLHGAAKLRLSVCAIVFIMWTWGIGVSLNISRTGGEDPWLAEISMAVPFSNFLCYVLCVVLFVRGERDEKAFISVAVAKIMCLMVLWHFGFLISFYGRDIRHMQQAYKLWWTVYTYAFLVLAVASAALASLGRKRLARAPVVGKWLAKMLGPGARVRCTGAGAGETEEDDGAEWKAGKALGVSPTALEVVI
uniref:Uncharacterized protein n=1 Tax=Zooxanthella nutricula TaxID=1333877 RepID=A0A7S2JKB7_9DINO|mmetsp:Transcript_31744/g.95928  ORF Transcript_31744/g.95928 Transcript_31744/m.95928 type:complete len:569 (+) Transcript_31744:1495-3201(+)